jgi:hypothetical protein
MMTIYNLIPKWLLLILVVALAAVSAYVGIKMEYYKIDNAKLANDNKILAGNVAALQTSLSTCTQSLKAEADNATRQGQITQGTQDNQKQIRNICVKDDPNAKTNINDAIALSNSISARLHSK